MKTIVTGFNRQRVATSMLRPTLLSDIESGSFPWGVRDRQREPGTLDQGSEAKEHPSAKQHPASQTCSVVHSA